MPIVAKLIAIIIPKRLQVIEVQVAEQDHDRRSLDERLERIIEQTQNEVKGPL